MLSLAIGVPAGYAIARFAFRGADSFRLTIVSTRAFPIVILAIPLSVTFIRWGIDDSVLGVAIAHTALALPFAVLTTSSVFAGISEEYEEAAMTLGCSRAQGGVEGDPAARAARAGGGGDLRLHHLVERRLRRLGADAPAPDAAGAGADRVGRGAAALPRRGRFFLLAPSLIVIFFIRKYLFNMWGRVTQVDGRRPLRAHHQDLRQGLATNDVSLTVDDGEFIVLLGPSGCGKTTLLRCLAGLEHVDAGRILIGERDVTELPPGRRRIAMVFQNYAVFPHMTLYDNIAFGLKMQKESKATIKERVDSVAELVHIEDLLERYPAQISGGQRQRVALARAIATKADVLLMDEPLSNLDALLRMEMRAELKALLRQLGTTTIYVTHDQVEALSMGDRIAVMKAGVIAQVDTPLAVYDHPADTYVGGFVGTPPMNFVHAEVSANGGPPVVQLNGGSFTLTGRDGAALAGKQLTLGIRAEAIRVHMDATQGRVRARVLVVEPLGSHNLLTVRIGEDLLKVVDAARPLPAPDSDVWLELDPARIRWMDRESGHAVAVDGRRGRAARGRGSRSMSGAQTAAARRRSTIARPSPQQPFAVAIVGLRRRGEGPPPSGLRGVERRRRRRIRPAAVGDRRRARALPVRAAGLRQPRGAARRSRGGRRRHRARAPPSGPRSSCRRSRRASTCSPRSRSRSTSSRRAASSRRPSGQA